MRATETRLARIEQTMQHVVNDQAREAFQRENAAWRKAGGPVSLVCGTTRDDAEQRAAMLRELGMIQPIDKVHLLPMRPEFSKPFLRHCVLEDWGPEKRDAIRAALASPSPALPPGW